MEELIKKLYDETDKFNYEVVKEIKNNKGKINSYLLEELDNNIKNFNSKEGFPLFVDYALFLLAEFKEKKTFPLILKMLSIPNIDGYDMIFEGVMDKLSDIIVSVFDGNFKGLNEIIQNKDIDHYIREQVLETYIYFYNNNLINKNDLIQFLRDLILLYEYDDGIYNSILTVIINAHLLEMIPDVRKLFDMEAIDYYIRGGYTEFIDDLFNYNDTLDNVTQIDNIEDNMAWWHCFNQDNDKELDLKKAKENFKDFIEEDINKNVINYKKVGRNDPCPCGSGKKYKKCCLNKIENGLSYQKYIDESLKKYPKENNNKGELNFYAIFKEDYIEIDKLMYKVFKKKQIPMYIKRDEVKENEINYKYLDEAYVKIKEVVEEEKIKTIEEYDEKVSIHYSLYIYFDKYTNLIIEKIKNGKKEYIGILEEVIKYFYTTFKISEVWEYIFLAKIYDYYKITKKYEEAITFFESKLSNVYAKCDVYNYLFYLYYATYDYDEAIKKIDDMIDNETNEEIKEELMTMKMDYIDDEDDY